MNTKSLLIKIFLIALLTSDSLCRRSRSGGGCDLIELIITIILTIIYLTDKPGDFEDRRRVVFKDQTTGKQIQGGITIKGLESFYKDEIRALKQVEIYTYEKVKFGSPGTYIQFQFNISTLNASSTFFQTYPSEVAEFNHVGWKNKYKVSTLLNLTGSLNEVKDTIDFMDGLSLKSKDLGEGSIDLKVITVGSKPSSWVLRLFFYIFVIFFICCGCSFVTKHLENRKSDNSMSVAYSVMAGMLSIAEIKMIFLYYFVGVFWFWLLFGIFDLILTCLIYSELQEQFSYNTNRVYFIIGAILTCWVLFVSNDLFPFLVLYTYGGLIYDVLFNKKSLDSDNLYQIFTACIYQIFTLFSFYNNANPKYYKISIPSLVIFLLIAIPLHLLTWFYYDKDATKTFKCIEKFVNSNTSIRETREAPPMRTFTKELESQYKVRKWDEENFKKTENDDLKWNHVGGANDIYIETENNPINENKDRGLVRSKKDEGNEVGFLDF